MTHNKILKHIKHLPLNTKDVYFDTTYLESFKILNKEVSVVKVDWQTQRDMIHIVALVKSVYDLPMDYVAKKELRIVNSFSSSEEATLWCDLQDYQIIPISKLIRDTAKQRKGGYLCP